MLLALLLVGAGLVAMSGTVLWARTRRPVVRLARVPRVDVAVRVPDHVPAFRILRTEVDLADARSRAHVRAFARQDASG